MQRLLPVLAWFAVLACEGSQITDGTVKRRSGNHPAAAERGSENTSANPPIDFNKPNDPPIKGENGYLPAIPVPDAAVIPVAISGASLHCYRAESFHCEATGPDHKPLPFAPIKAFYSDPILKEWIEATFTVLPTTQPDGSVQSYKWSIVIPEAVQRKSFDVMLMDENSRFVTVSITIPPVPSKNIALDGSFEDQIIDPNNLEMTRFLIPALQNAWRSTPTTKGCLGILQLDSALTTPEMKPSKGNQWIELAAPCESGLGSTREKVQISQTFQLKIGQRYRLGFDYRTHLSSAFPGILNVSLNGQVVLTSGAPLATWLSHSLTFIAKQQSTTLMFEDLGQNVFYGMAIDNVTLYEENDSL